MLYSPSWFVSRAHDKYQLSLDFSRASRSYFSSVRLSTIPVSDIIWPPIVDFPASTNRKLKTHSEYRTKNFFFDSPTCPIKTTFTCSFLLQFSSTLGGFRLVDGFGNARSPSARSRSSTSISYRFRFSDMLLSLIINYLIVDFVISIWSQDGFFFIPSI